MHEPQIGAVTFLRESGIKNILHSNRRESSLYNNPRHTAMPQTRHKQTSAKPPLACLAIGHIALARSDAGRANTYPLFFGTSGVRHDSALPVEPMTCQTEISSLNMSPALKNEADGNHTLQGVSIYVVSPPRLLGLQSPKNHMSVFHGTPGTG
jgi:hypothetical protein